MLYNWVSIRSFFKIWYKQLLSSLWSQLGPELFGYQYSLKYLYVPKQKESHTNLDQHDNTTFLIWASSLILSILHYSHFQCSEVSYRGKMSFTLLILLLTRSLNSQYMMLRFWVLDSNCAGCVVVWDRKPALDVTLSHTAVKSIRPQTGNKDTRKNAQLRVSLECFMNYF